MDQIESQINHGQQRELPVVFTRPSQFPSKHRRNQSHRKKTAAMGIRILYSELRVYPRTPAVRSVTIAN